MLAHTGPFYGVDFDGARPSLAAEVLRGFPNLSLILTECGGRPYFQEAIALAEDYPQVAFHCTGGVAGNPGPDDPNNQELVGLFRSIGTHRVMFGSDWPFRNPLQDIQRLQGLPPVNEEKRAILFDNARLILKLS